MIQSSGLPATIALAATKIEPQEADMRAIYCFRYLSHVARGIHGPLTARQIWGDVRSIWLND